MPDTFLNECLSVTDAFFLYLEQPGAPLNVASIGAFEGTIPLNDCMEYIDSKLPLIPRFLQRVVTPPFGIGTPSWQRDPHFDVRNHVHAITLKRGTEAEWKTVVSQILSANLDRSRPLWDVTLCHGLNGNRTGVVVRCHHCLVDGIAGVALLKVLLDESPIQHSMRRKRQHAKPPTPHAPGAMLLDGIIHSCFSTAQALLTAHSELLRMAQQASSPPNGVASHDHSGVPGSNLLAMLGPLGKVAQLLSELAYPTERLPYNVLCRGPQKFDWAQLNMQEIIGVKEACDATVNEVVLTVLTGALRRYAELHGLKAKGRTLRLVIPVDVRSETEEAGTGNHITFLPVDIPFGCHEPRKLLSIIQDRVAFSRAGRGAEMVALIGMMADVLPAPLQSLTGKILSRLPISICNSICTNVHGPKTPLYLLGHKMLSSFPYVPIGGEMGMNCAVLSYDGSLFVGFTGDAPAIPDISKLAKFFAESFIELRNAVGVSAQRKPRLPRKPRPKHMAEVTGIREVVPLTGEITSGEKAAAIAVVA